MEFRVFLLAFVLITTTWISSAHGKESPAETYWKMNLGNDNTMPKLIKDALLGTQNNVLQAYAQQLSGIRTNRPTKDYSNVAQDYAQQLSGIRSIRSYNVYGGNVPLADSQQLSKAQAYAQQLSRTKTNLAATKVYDDNAAQAYAQQLSRTKTSLAAKVYDIKGSKPTTDDSVIFFLEKDIVHPGTRMKLHFLMGAQEAKFMPRELTNSIPFSPTKLPQILKYFNVNPTSANAKIIEETITMCKSKPIKGETKTCKTTLESMINYVKSRLGSQIKALSTEIDKETEQEYTIESARKIKSEKNIVCHKMEYPYAVFLCHTLSKTDAYQVSLIDSNGKKVRAVGVCHKDTSPWNPGHVAFQLLKVKPGGVPICHFLDADTMIWVTK